MDRSLEMLKLIYEANRRCLQSLDKSAIAEIQNYKVIPKKFYGTLKILCMLLDCSPKWDQK